MREFAALMDALEVCTDEPARVSAIVAYLQCAEPEDAAWGVRLLATGPPQRTVAAALLRTTAITAAGIPGWLFDASEQASGDLAETIAWVLPPPRAPSSSPGLAQWMAQRLPRLRGAAPERQAALLAAGWDELEPPGRWLLCKLAGGGLRPGVAGLTLQRALARHAGLRPTRVALRLPDFTRARQPPDAASLAALLAPAEADVAAQVGEPLAFAEPEVLEVGDPAPKSLARQLGEPSRWRLLWQHGGQRAQLVRRTDGVWLWSPDGELLAGRFPEVEACAAALPPGTVLDGELLVWPEGQRQPAAYPALQRRLDRQAPGPKLRAELPVVFVAWDLLEHQGADLRAQPQRERRRRLEALPACGPLRASQQFSGMAWSDLVAEHGLCRTDGALGLLLWHPDAPYDRRASDALDPDLVDHRWRSWLAAACRIDAVLVYAQPGGGNQAGLFSSCSLAVWNRPPRDSGEARSVVDAIARGDAAQAGGLQLVTICRACTGLGDDECLALDRIVREQTLKKFGAVRLVLPMLVVELAFDGVQRSARHKSGLALRAPRMTRLRLQAVPHEAGHLVSLQALCSPP